MMYQRGNHHIELGTAVRTIPGQIESGDLYTVQSIPTGSVIAVVDGLGHGGEAAFAARTAIETIASHSEESAVSLLKLCHEELKGTRGVVMGIVEVNCRDDTMTWLAVGNVEGILLRSDPAASPPYETIMQRGGTVGFRLPPLQASVLSLAHGDTIIMATDGIASGFEREFRAALHPQKLADKICDRHARHNDDALVLVAKYLRSTS